MALKVVLCTTRARGTNAQSKHIFTSMRQISISPEQSPIMTLKVVLCTTRARGTNTRSKYVFTSMRQLTDQIIMKYLYGTVTRSRHTKLCCVRHTRTKPTGFHKYETTTIITDKSPNLPILLNSKDYNNWSFINKVLRPTSDQLIEPTYSIYPTLFLYSVVWNTFYPSLSQYCS